MPAKQWKIYIQINNKINIYIRLMEQHDAEILTTHSICLVYFWQEAQPGCLNNRLHRLGAHLCFWSRVQGSRVLYYDLSRGWKGFWTGFGDRCSSQHWQFICFKMFFDTCCAQQALCRIAENTEADGFFQTNLERMNQTPLMHTHNLGRSSKLECSIFASRAGLHSYQTSSSALRIKVTKPSQQQNATSLLCDLFCELCKPEADHTLQDALSTSAFISVSANLEKNWIQNPIKRIFAKAMQRSMWAENDQNSPEMVETWPETTSFCSQKLALTKHFWLML